MMETDVKIRNWPVGANIEARDAEWRILSVDPVKGDGHLLKCVGLSNIVRGRVAYFFTAYETGGLRLLQPENTNFVQDTTPKFMLTRLYLESVLRTAPKTDNKKLYVSYKAAMDPLPYQFNPTLQALQQPRPRILIADAVGIGKTLEAGILTSELIARGRAKRILVLATKAVLPQFQQEFWNRFSIPLTALDSAGIQRVREKIPSNQNPFFYFDKAIISIDTLKKDEVYRELISKANWDLIIIDEAHNVAQRTNHSQRAKLARLLSGRSDAMIMLTATPHDGKAESFASLLNVLDPTAIADNSSYTPEDFESKGLVIRRFKHHIQNQISQDFPKRIIEKIEIEASDEEKAVIEKIHSLTFRTLDRKKSKGTQGDLFDGDKASPSSGFNLFRTTLIKAFFSSPAACLSLIKNRVKKLKSKLDLEEFDSSDTSVRIKEDLAKLEGLRGLVEKVTSEKFSKLNLLAEMINPKDSTIGWKAESDDRIVVFTESLVTLDYLSMELPGKAKLKPDQIVILKGTMSDAEIAEKVNEFNRADSKARVLLASDVASEGINLHHFAHRMIHFDIPWSLMTFQQRNGRVDRYGQTKQPEIYYLLTKSDDSKTMGDMRVLEVLIEKDQKAQENLKDPLEFLTQDKQEEIVGQAIEESQDPLMADDLVSALINMEGVVESDEIMGSADKISAVLTREDFENAKAKKLSLFDSDMEFAIEGLRLIAKEQNLSENELKIDGGIIDLQPTADLSNCLKYLPPEIIPADNHFKLTSDPKAIQNSMKKMRNEGEKWPDLQLLWENHPIMEWMEGRFLNAFGRNSVPLLKIENLDSTWILLRGGYPNRRGYIPVHRFVAVRFKDGQAEIFSLEEMIEALELEETIFNTGKAAGQEEVKKHLEQAIGLTKDILLEDKKKYEEIEKPKLESVISNLKDLKKKHEAKITEGNAIGEKINARQKEKLNDLEVQFKRAETFEKENVELENEPFIQVVAAFTGKEKE